MLIIDGTYESLQQSVVEAVFFMEIQPGRNDSFEVYGQLPGGAVMHVTAESEPATFRTDFPEAVKVNSFTLT